MKASDKQRNDTKWVFVKKGTCSRTLFHILNTEFDHNLEYEEKAIDPLAGGIMQNGYQCGLLWGASMGLGAEAHKRTKCCSEACALAISSSMGMVKSFQNAAGSTDCYDITDTDFGQTKEMAKYMLSGKFLSCFKLADKWAPEAIRIGKTELNSLPETWENATRNCASEIVRLAGGTELEQVLVAGWSGGIGLSGKGCGALAAAIWFITLRWCQTHQKNPGYNNEEAQQVLEQFLPTSDFKFECQEITERRFHSIEEHIDYVKNDGCREIIEGLVANI